jgi:hypothetical protein
MLVGVAEICAPLVVVLPSAAKLPSAHIPTRD